VTSTVLDRNGQIVLHYADEGPKIGTERDASEVIRDTLQFHYDDPDLRYVDVVVIPVERFMDGFFTMSTRLLGEFVQKVTLTGLRLAIVGDLTGHTENSETLRDIVYESNRRGSLWFPADLDELDRRLERANQ
jgi:hypothetical protein